MSSGERGDARREALEAARRVYDRQIAELENIDDKAMRTSRTGILILGFVAAGLTAAGPSFAENFHPVPVTLGIAGTLAIFASAFLSVGVYTVTMYDWEIQPADLQAARFTSRGRWMDAATDTLDEASEGIEHELVKNARYLELSQMFLLAGSFFFLIGAIYSVIHQSYGIEPWKQAVIMGAISLLVVIAARLKSVAE